MPQHYLEGIRRIFSSDNADFNSADNPWKTPQSWETASNDHYKYYQKNIGDKRDNNTEYGVPDIGIIETLHGLAGNDKILGRGGSDNLWGGEGNDVLALGDLRGEQNDNLYGGIGADLIIFGEVDNGNPANFNWGCFATRLISSADNFLKLVPGTGDAANVVGLYTDLVLGAIGSNQQGINPAKSTKAVIHDFNPIEDIVVFPLQLTGRNNVGIDAPVNDNGTIQFRYEENNTTDYFADLNQKYDIYANASDKTSTARRNRDFKESLLENALIISEDCIRQGWKPNVKYNPSGNLITESDLNIDLSGLEGQRFVVLGAYAGQEFEGSANSDTMHGTKYELAQANDQLEQLVADLQRSNQELEQFAYMASHDLQEPLRAIISYIQKLAQRYQGQLDEKADLYLNFAVDGANRMQLLIQALLSYSRVGKQELKLESTDCNMILNRVLRDLRVAIAESHAKITLDPLPRLQADPTQLSLLFQNLIGNAIKFRSKTLPQIQVIAKKESSHWQFSIRDNGIGIEPQYSDRIFSIFQRLHTNDEYPGTGLGLAICQKIVENHGGRIWVESTLGKGSTFTFELPDVGGND